jgi:hypothetical protein
MKRVAMIDFVNINHFFKISKRLDILLSFHAFITCDSFIFLFCHFERVANKLSLSIFKQDEINMVLIVLDNL